MAASPITIPHHEGAETPRAEAFFHTPGGPPLRVQRYISRQFLEPLQTRVRAYMGWPPETTRKEMTFLRANDGKPYHSEYLPQDAEYPVQVVVADMIPTKQVCARCGRGLAGAR